MTKDEIVRIAKEAGGELEDGLWMFFERECLRFANMIAAHEREACAKVCNQIAYSEDDPIGYQCAEAIRARGNP